MSMYPKIPARLDAVFSMAVDAHKQGPIVEPTVPYCDIEEKVDGSQFTFRALEDGELEFFSKRRKISDPDDGMFGPTIKHLQRLQGRIPAGLFFHGEAVSGPRHNIITYDRVPHGHIVLWDARGVTTRTPWSRPMLEQVGENLNLEVTPLLARGAFDLDELKALIADLLEKPSYLGGIREGVVIKWRDLADPWGNRPLAVKVVSEAFAERGKRKIKKPKEAPAQIIGREFCTEARWRKAIQRLKEDGDHTGTPKDIGKLIPMIQQDIWEEHGDEIRERLTKAFRKDLNNAFIQGFPQWYARGGADE